MGNAAKCSKNTITLLTYRLSKIHVEGLKNIDMTMGVFSMVVRSIIRRRVFYRAVGGLRHSIITTMITVNMLLVVLMNMDMRLSFKRQCLMAITG